MICMQQMCKSCDNKVFFIQALPLLISCWLSFYDWTHLEDQKCEMIKHGSKNRPSQSLKMKRKQTLAVCHCCLFQHKKTTSFIMLNICCVYSIPMWPLLTSGIITHNKTQIKYYLHAVLFSCVAPEIANFVNISGSNHHAPSVPH